MNSMHRALTAVLAAVVLFPPFALAASPAVPSCTASLNPFYSGYDFGRSPRVINFGMQPLALPIGVLTEVMRRDRILRGVLKQKGFEIRFHAFLKGDDMSPFLRQGKIDAAVSGDMPTILTASSSDIVIPALAKQGFSSIVALEHTPLAGLKGKRIAYPAVSNGHYALLAALSSAGLKETDVRMMPMEVSDMVDALAAHRVDAFVASEPVPTVVAKTIPRAAVVYRHLNSSYLFFTRSLTERDPEIAPLIVASMVRALAWLTAKEENLLLASRWMREAANLLQRKPVELTVEEVGALTLKEIANLSPHPTIPERDLTDKGNIRKEFDFLKSRGKIPSSVAAEKILRSFNRSIVTQVAKNPGKYKPLSFDYDAEPVAAGGRTP